MEYRMEDCIDAFESERETLYMVTVGMCVCVTTVES